MLSTVPVFCPITSMCFSCPRHRFWKCLQLQPRHCSRLWSWTPPEIALALSPVLHYELPGKASNRKHTWHGKHTWKTYWCVLILVSFSRLEAIAIRFLRSLPHLWSMRSMPRQSPSSANGRITSSKESSLPQGNILQWLMTSHGLMAEIVKLQT